MSAAVAHAYRYLAPSRAEAAGLRLATSSKGDVHPYFFEGKIVHARTTAELLTAVQVVVGTRFYVPPNAKDGWLNADPVVTSGADRLRFEGFSACCSVYARLDLLPDGITGDVVGRGTTNVDFNPTMRQALARVQYGDALGLAIGGDEVRLRAAAGDVVEKKVELPLRWIRGLLEVQSYQASMTERFTVTAAHALRFLRTLPRATTRRTPLYVVPAGGGLRTTTVADGAGVRVVDVQRLRVLEPLLARASSLTVYADDTQQASAWVAHFPGARFVLVVSAEPWRGFSGEGQALRALARPEATALLPRVRASLTWESAIDAAALARTLAVPRDVVDDALRVLGVSGLVGYDVVDGAYFHRVLPLDRVHVEEFHPRLVAARELIEAGAVRVVTREPLAARVASGDGEYLVTTAEGDGELTCTCPWFGKHRGERGPCKHALAAEIAVRA